MRTDKKLWRNRKAKKELARRLQSENPGLEVVHAHAAGIDVGNSAHYVAVRPDCDPQPVRRFECFTADLYRLADWLHSLCCEDCGPAVDRRILDSPIRHLEERGFEVYLVNARHTKNLPGRKSDVQESQWLLKLHTYGLLNNSFQPASKIRILRTYWRQRLQHVTGAATCVQRMQKALTQMNIQLANVISDSQRSDWAVDRTGHRRRGTRPAEARGTQSSSDSSQPRGDSQKPGRQLAPGADLCAATGNRDVRHLPATGRRV